MPPRHNLFTKIYMDKCNIINNIEHLVDVGKVFEIKVTGYSMLPLLGYDEDKITILRIDENTPILNRIAMFRSKNGQIIVHRIIEVSNELVTLRGDGNIFGYEKCLRKEIIGVVESVIRKNGKEYHCLSQWWLKRERIWLLLPLTIRRYILAIIPEISSAVKYVTSVV